MHELLVASDDNWGHAAPQARAHEGVVEAHDQDAPCRPRSLPPARAHLSLTPSHSLAYAAWAHVRPYLREVIEACAPRPALPRPGPTGWKPLLDGPN